MSLRDRGIVLSCRPFRESSQLLRVLCSEGGKLSLLARGSRRARGRRWHGDFEPGDEIGLLYFPRPRAGLHLMGEARHLCVRPRLRRDLAAWGAALYALRVVDILTVVEDPHGVPLETLRGALDGLASGQDPVGVTLLLELSLLREAGFLPDLSGCPQCRAPWEARRIVRTGTLPGFACERCVPGRPWMRGASLSLGETLVVRGPGAIGAASPATIADLARAIGWTLCLLLGRPVRARRFALGRRGGEAA